MSGNSYTALYFFFSIFLFQSGIIIAADQKMIPHRPTRPHVLSPAWVALLTKEAKLQELANHLNSICAKENPALSKFCKLYKNETIRTHLLEFYGDTSELQLTAPCRAITTLPPHGFAGADGRTYNISTSRGKIEQYPLQSRCASPLFSRSLSPMQEDQVTISIANPPKGSEDFFEPSIFTIEYTGQRKAVTAAFAAILRAREQAALSPRHRQRAKPTPPLSPRPTRLVPTPLLLDVIES